MSFEMEQIGNCTLYRGDCREVVLELPKRVALVTDPPYGQATDRWMNRDSGRWPRGAAASKGYYDANGWDDVAPTAEELEKLRALARYQVIFGGNYFGLPAARGWLIWDKLTEGRFGDCELAWTNLDMPIRRLVWMWNGMLRRGQEERYGHPTQKPVGLMLWCLRFVPEDYDVVLDPYMGSGTTGVACVQMGRSFIGVEIERKYFDLACQRITAASAQLNLFHQTSSTIALRQERLL